MIRAEVQTLAELGALPASADADEQALARYESLLGSIDPPVSVEEAEALVGLFGPDECFGLAWALIHLIETAPGWPLEYCLTDTSCEWIRLLRQRAGLGE